jgi:hypothetical protein
VTHVLEGEVEQVVVRSCHASSAVDLPGAQFARNPESKAAAARRMARVRLADGSNAAALFARIRRQAGADRVPIAIMGA